MDSLTGQTSGYLIKATPLASEICEWAFQKLGNHFY